jgi:hypothetical protein
MSKDNGRAIVLMLAQRHRKARQELKRLPIDAPGWLGTMHTTRLLEAKEAHEKARQIGG